MKPLAIFTSHFSLGESLLTLEPPGKAKVGNPISVFDLAKRGNLTHVHLHESRLDGFLSAYSAATKAGLTLCFGLKLTICADMSDKSEPSRRTESKVIIMVKNTQGYHDLIRIANRAWTDGHFTHRDSSYGRGDWHLLRTFWTENLDLALPYFSSFVARNLLTMSQITPSLPVATPWVLREVKSELPFSSLIDSALDRYISGSNLQNYIVPSKTIYYEKRSDFKAYQTFRAINNRASFNSPGVDHLASSAFSYESFECLTKR
jgi:DNA polymerase III alpha subunit